MEKNHGPKASNSGRELTACFCVSNCISRSTGGENHVMMMRAPPVSPRERNILSSPFHHMETKAWGRQTGRVGEGKIKARHNLNSSSSAGLCVGKFPRFEGGGTPQDLGGRVHCTGRGRYECA